MHLNSVQLKHSVVKDGAKGEWPGPTALGGSHLWIPRGLCSRESFPSQQRQQGCSYGRYAIVSDSQLVKVESDVCGEVKIQG